MAFKSSRSGVIEIESETNTDKRITDCTSVQKKEYKPFQRSLCSPKALIHIQTPTLYASISQKCPPISPSLRQSLFTFHNIKQKVWGMKVISLACYFLHWWQEELEPRKRVIFFLFFAVSFAKCRLPWMRVRDLAQ